MIRIWQFDLDRNRGGESDNDDDDLIRRASWVLPVAEQQRATRFPAGRLRTRFLASRLLLRHLLGECLGLAPDQVQIARGETGKPYLAAGGDLRFSQSHSDNLMLVAVSEQRELGIDVVHVDMSKVNPAMAPMVFSPRELAEWHSLPAGRRWPAFFTAWTQKEALLKATGQCLRVAPNEFELPAPGSSCVWSSRTWSRADIDLCGGHGHPGTVDPGTVAALAYEGDGDEVVLEPRPGGPRARSTP